MSAFTGFIGGLVLTLLGIAQLRRVWARADASRWRTVSGWALIAAGFAGWLAVADADKAVAVGLLAFSIMGYAVVAMGMDRRRRPHRAPKPAAAPPLATASRRRPLLRGLARTLLAGPAAAAFALALAALVAVHGGGGDIDRLVAGGFIAPVVWGAAMTWALADARLARVGLLLPLATGLSVAAAWLGRV